VADNVGITPGTGATVRAVDNGAGLLKQVMMLDVGAENAESLCIGSVPVSGTVSVSNLPGTQPVSGTVTANAGTNLNTSALATESGGNLAAVAGAAGTTADTAWSGSGNATLIAALKALWTDLRGTPVLVAASLTRSANTTAYSANQVLTAAAGGSVAIAGCARAAGKGGWIESIEIEDGNNAATPIQPILFLFNAAPTSLADNAALALTTSDTAKFVCAIPLFESYLVNAAAGASGLRKYVVRGLNIPFTIPSGTSLYAYVVNGGAYTPVSGEVLSMLFGIEQN
jgi:hypothetical protein